MNAPCGDCGTETLPVDARDAEYYMVADAVWSQAGAPAGYLCVGCLEVRLGRRLTLLDFPDIPVNRLAVSRQRRYAWSWRTPRLESRLSGHAAWGAG